MPHFTIEYSANLDTQVDPRALVKEGQDVFRAALNLPRSTRYLSRAERGLIAFLETGAKPARRKAAAAKSPPPSHPGRLKPADLAPAHAEPFPTAPGEAPGFPRPPRARFA